MHANLVRWRLDESVRDPEAYARFLAQIARRNVPILRHFGLLDSFVVRTSADTVTFINLFETEAEAEAAWHALSGPLGHLLSGKVKVLERISARADDLPDVPERYG